ncbi:hypothetical protein BDW74DRAFT_177368 [Aspergillus multicolor]|uniref:uncharacterized protein n=1 Tax=Aspergillus multicolor TaxID=41759 RepID=UPI003CCD1DA0
MPDFDGFSIEWQAPEAMFEAAVYNLLSTETDIRASRLLCHRVPVQYPGPKLSVPKDLAGCRLFVFEKAKGVDNVWRELSDIDKMRLLDQLADIRAALFHYNTPSDFIQSRLLSRIYNFMPETLTQPIAPTRDMIGWEDDNKTVGPIALAAKESLLRALPHLMPPETADKSLYRLTLEHEDFGNTTPQLKSPKRRVAAASPLSLPIFDWETGCIVPALLSDPLVAVNPVDLTAKEDGDATVTGIPKDATQSDMKIYFGWAGHYIQRLYNKTPEYKVAIQAGKDIRYLWFKLRDWRGGDSERFFGGLGKWAEKRMRELGVDVD